MTGLEGSLFSAGRLGPLIQACIESGASLLGWLSLFRYLGFPMVEWEAWRR